MTTMTLRSKAAASEKLGILNKSPYTGELPALPDGEFQQLLNALWVEVLKVVNPLQALM